MKIEQVSPGASVEGGIISIMADAVPVEHYADIRVFFGSVRGHILSMSSRHLRVQVPEGASGDVVQVFLGDEVIATAKHVLGVSVLKDINAVDNPIVDTDGNVYTMNSGARTSPPDVAVYKILPDLTVEPYITDILSATSLAFDSKGQLYISSRFESRIYRVINPDELEVYVEDVGTPFGIVFHADDTLYIGDREGHIYKISPTREKSILVDIPPSPIAYHLVFDLDGNLLVSVPRLGMDAIYFIDIFGNTIPYLTGIGRPQGMAFDEEGQLYVCHGGVNDGGVFRVDANGNIEKIIASPGATGIAFDGQGNVWLNTPNSLYRLPLGIFPRKTLKKPASILAS